MTTLDEYTKAVLALKQESMWLDEYRARMIASGTKDDRKAFERKLDAVRKAGIHVNTIESDMRWEAECKVANVMGLPMPKRHE